MSEVTYGRLDEALRALGFSSRVVEGKARWYKHEETGAVIALPEFSLDDPVLPRHLAAVRGTLEIYGIADPLDFALRLQKAS